MKKSIILTAIFGLLGLSPLHASFDGTVGIKTTPGRIPPGGPFEVTVMASTSTAMNQIQAVANNLPFISFCLERSEQLNQLNAGGQGYKVCVAQKAIDGGPGGGVNGDPISLATAWLYSQFRAGTLVAAGYANNAAGNNQLQAAIYYLEQETSSVGGVALNLVNAAITALNSFGVVDLATARSINANGEFRVRVLNVFDTNGINKLQDQLALVPEPSTYVAGALLLIPVLAQIRRWKRSA